MAKEKTVLSPKFSLKGWNFFTLINKHRDGVIAFAAFLVFLLVLGSMLASSAVYEVQEVVLVASTSSGGVWTMLHGWVYFKNEQTK